MGYTQQYLTMNSSFGEYICDFDKADYIIFGVPLDITSTYRSGSRFAPLAIREASKNLESYSLRVGMDVDDSRVFDAGDLIIDVVCVIGGF